MVVKDHMYDCAIVDIKFHGGGGGGGGVNTGGGAQRVISADRRVVKVWDASTGEGYTSIEPADGADINDVCVWRGSGLIMAATDSPRVQSFFVPSLGPAPRWCSFLESLTEELEESANPTVYDDYRFITKPDLVSKQQPSSEQWRWILFEGDVQGRQGAPLPDKGPRALRPCSSEARGQRHCCSAAADVALLPCLRPPRCAPRARASPLLRP
jgi:hypothetical protein